MVILRIIGRLFFLCSIFLWTIQRFTLSESSLTVFHEKQVLVDLHFKNGGGSWFNSWNISSDPCKGAWYGIECNWDVVAGKYSIVEIRLKSNNLYGSLINMTKMSSLWYLDLSQNMLSGTIPKFSECDALESIDLSSNYFTGVSDLSHLQRLKNLELSTNHIPKFLENDWNLSSLQYLGLSHTELSGIFAAVLQMPMLQTLDISDNMLLGEVPSFNKYDKLERLILGSNYFTRAGDLSHLRYLSYLDLSACWMEGSFLELGSNLTALMHLDLSENAITGTIPSLRNMPSLRTLDVTDNFLFGTVPGFSEIRYLETLKVGNNFLFEIEDLSHLEYLSYLDFSINTFPLFLERKMNLSSLKYLDVSFTGLSGTLPEMMKMPLLETLLVSENGLTGSVPKFQSYPYLKILKLDANYLTGMSDLSHLEYLSHLDLSGNSLGGSMEWNWNLSSLNELIMSNNVITGTLPDPRKGCRLRKLVLSGNQWSGSVPGFQACDSLETIDLSSNYFTGVSDLSHLQNLTFLELTNNHIPKFLENDWNLSSLQYLGLSNTGLSGLFAAVLQMPMLQTLDISDNMLLGEVPSFNKYDKLERLILGSNYFTRVGDLSHLRYLSYLDLSSNHIPSFLTLTMNLSALKELNLCDTGLVGSVPKGIHLPVLRSLDLSTNRLTGTVGGFDGYRMLETLNLHDNSFTTFPSLSNLSHLFFLDLSSNKLSKVEGILNNMSSLAYLDLSDNLLSGTIPSFEMARELQFLFLSGNSYSAISYLPPNIFYLDLSSNQLSELREMPYLPNLLFLNLSRNGLMQIPDFGDKSPYMLTLDLSHNRLHGTLPDSFLGAKISQLNILYLSSNMLSGGLLSSFRSVVFPYMEIFTADHNHFTGPIVGLGKMMPILWNLNLASNELTGPIRDSFSSLIYLSICNLAGNQFSGDIMDFPLSLEILDLSDNALTGQIPDTLFSLVGLKVLTLSKNCFSGTFPRSVCSAYSLTVLAMDGLGSQDSCQSLFFPQSKMNTYQLKHSFQGSVPMCIFGLISLETLHLSGNGLQGKLPADLEVSPTDLVISYNRFTGVVPNVFFSRPFKNLDFSFNRLKGRLISGNLTGSDIEDTRLVANNNRLSGSITSSLFPHISYLSVLGGNMFDCNVENGENMVPRKDPEAGSYSCGSQTVNNSFIVWLAIVSSLVGVLFLQHLPKKKTKPDVTPVLLRSPSRLARYSNSLQDLPRGLANLYLLSLKWWNRTKAQQIEGGVSLRGLHKVGIAFVSLRKLALFIFIIIVVIFLPAYSSLRAYRTHEDSYVWIVSLGYLSGLYPGLLVFFLLLFLLYLPVLLILNRMNYHMNLDLSDVLESLRKNASKDNMARTWKSFIIRVLIILINLAVTMAINIFYVYYVNQRISSEKRIVLQFGAAWLKLMWNVAFHFFKYALKVIDEESSYDREGYGKVQLLSFLNVFNFVLAPVIAAVAFDSNCFKYVFFTPPNVTVSYNVVTPFPSSINYFSWDTVTASTISYQPPFIYNYQCTSTVLSEFTTVFVYKYTFSLFFLLVRAIAVVILIKYRFASDLISTFFIPKQLHFSILKLRREGDLWNPLEWIESRFRISKKNQGTKCYEADSTVISLIGDFAVLLTFGMVFPPLAVVVVLSILSQTVFHQLLIGRLVCELEDAVDAEMDRPDNEERWELPQEYLKIILSETEVIWEYFQPSVKYISFFSPIFLSFFLFDIMGDKVGFTGAIWILPLMAFTPLIDSVIYLVGTSCWMFLKAICIYSGLQQQASTSASSFLSKHSSVIPVAEVASDHEKSQKNLEDNYDFPAVPTLSLMNQDEAMKELEILEAQPTKARETQATNEYEHHHIRSIRDQHTPSPSKSLETIFGFLLNNE